MKKIILMVIAVILIVPYTVQCDTGDAAKNLKLIKLTEDTTAEDSYRPIAGREKLLAVKVVDETGRGVFGAKVKFSVPQANSGFIKISTAEIPVSEIEIMTNIIGEAVVFLRIPDNKTNLTPRAILSDKPNEGISWNIQTIEVPRGLERNFWHKALKDNEEKFKSYKANLEITSNAPGQPSRKVVSLQKRASKKLKITQSASKNYETSSADFWYPPLYDTEAVAYSKKTDTVVFRNTLKKSLYPYRLLYVSLPKGIVLKEERYRYFQNGLVHKFETEYSGWQEDTKMKSYRYNTKVIKANSGLNKEKFRTTTKIINWQEE